MYVKDKKKKRNEIEIDERKKRRDERYKWAGG
jgi:hypothetical protein